MLGWVVNLFVDTEHKSDIFILRRSGDNDFLDRPAKMLLGIVGIGEVAGRFEYDLGSNRFPGKLGWVSLRENLEGLIVNCDAVGTGRDLVAQVAQNGVVLEQVGERLRVREIVDRDEFNVG